MKKMIFLILVITSNLYISNLLPFFNYRPNKNGGTELHRIATYCEAAWPKIIASPTLEFLNINPFEKDNNGMTAREVATQKSDNEYCYYLIEALKKYEEKYEKTKEKTVKKE